MNGFPEEELRSALRALADGPAVPVAAPTPHAAVRAAARIRRRRRAAGAGLAAAAAVLAVLAAPWPSADGSRTPAPAPPAATAAPTDPAGPALGVPYPHELYVHCGVRYTKFAGRWWHAEPEVPEGALDPALRADDPYTPGTMVLVSPAEARFVRHAPDLAVTFRPLAEEPPPCD
ncbi:hypothetical protein M8Z33_10430 [Streptomyces sp. ZAF1911]|uniref:hypothetical protein n=1 Tax=Streptomyces sp. ZAF1911 TaxID=2944129 RepID=UPI00237B6CA1|nr:hypothetical protein [Streptomyces sp. ZAF1911]MDD9377079.1 hypothetical protein [Streptomyces sp. ZAF1911]